MIREAGPDLRSPLPRTCLMATAYPHSAEVGDVISLLITSVDQCD